MIGDFTVRRSTLVDLALWNITNIHHSIVNANIAMEDVVLFEEYLVSC